MDAATLTLACAYGLDLAVGDPRWIPHPVRGLGRMIQWLEKILRAAFQDESFAGWILVIGIGSGTFVVARTISWSGGYLSSLLNYPSWLRFILDVLLLYVCLSTRDLAVESWAVYETLRFGDLPAARSKVGMIVGRDTDRMDEREVVRATLETIGESTLDGIIAPLFYAVLGGVPWACLYKAINTLDSMVGYRSARYIKFGRPAAQIDTWMNMIPARITAWLFVLVAPLVGFSASGSFRATYRDAWYRGQNSWIPEAALAGALGVQLGGTNFYSGKLVQTPNLGYPTEKLELDRIPQAIRLMYACSFLGIVAALFFRWVIDRIWWVK